MADVTGMQSAGRVLPIFKGDYSGTKMYEQTDIVLYNMSSYIALQDTIGNPPPNNGINRNEYWQLVAKGADTSKLLEKTGDSSNTKVTMPTEDIEFENVYDSNGKLIPTYLNGDSLNYMFAATEDAFSKLAKVSTTGNYSDINGRLTLTNSLLANQPGTALDAMQGPILKEESSIYNVQKKMGEMADAQNVITVNMDLDDLIAPGSYRSNSAVTTNTLLHKPDTLSGTGFRLDVIQTTGNNWFIQKIQTHQAKPQIYERAYMGDHYEPWERITTSNDIDQINSDLNGGKVLWSGSVNTADTIIELNDSIKNYRLIGILTYPSGYQLYLFDPNHCSYFLIRTFNIGNTLGANFITLYECRINIVSDNALSLGDDREWNEMNFSGDKWEGVKRTDTIYVNKVIGYK